MFYPLSASTWGNEELDAIQRVLKNGRTTMGDEVRAFEREFADYHGRRFGIMVNSGSSANLIAVAALFYKKDNPLQRGDDVLVPAISWATTYHPLQQHGLSMSIMDVELETLNFDWKALYAHDVQAKSNYSHMFGRPATRAVMGVSILGNPANLATLSGYAKEHGLYFIEDNCESLDAEMGGKKTGTFGDMSTFSFFFSHHIQTMEGGMILTDDEELAQLCVSLRAHGWTRDLPKDNLIAEPRENDRYEAYRFVVPGYNVRPLELSGAIGRVQLRKLPAFTEQRRKNLAIFQNLFQGDDRFIIQKENGKSSAFSFPIILNPKHCSIKDRDRVFMGLINAGIEHRVVTGGNILRHDVIKHYDYSVIGGSAPNADIVHDYGFFVGNYPQDLTEQLHKLHEVLSQAI